MLNVIVVSIRFIRLIFAGQKQVALENVALRQQLAVFKRDVRRPKLNGRDRLFWIGLRMIWQDWKSALVIVRPETVISWQAFQTVLVEAIPTETTWPSTSPFRDPEAYSSHVNRPSDMGSTTSTW